MSQIANRFREIILNGDWVVGSNYRAHLSDITWEQAIRKTGSLNTIADLVCHIHYYISGVLKVLEGGTLEIKDEFSFNHSPIKSQEEWQSLLAIVWNDSERLANIVEQMTDDSLKRNFSDEKYGDYEKNINALIEHSYYHLGQIVLLKKMNFDNQTSSGLSI